MDNNASEQECRVCRCEAEEGRPLYTPCLCSGSIGLVHQDCLEAWLDHSKKDTCELCLSKYQFAPEYAENTPTTLPPLILLKSMISLVFYKLLPFMIRFFSALVVWIIFIPVSTTSIYCLCIGRDISIFEGVAWFDNFTTSIVTGIVLIATIGLSLLMMV
jgi:E3 ubiquitin-protein ligase MARCH6